MHYKTILVHVDDTPNAGLRYGVAARLAQWAQAQLVGLASTGLTRFIRETMALDFANPAIAPYLDTMRTRAARSLDDLARAAEAHGVAAPERRQTDDEPYSSLGALAAYSDLCILGLHGGPLRPDGQPRHMGADLAAASGCPVLLIPDGAQPLPAQAGSPFQRILLGWNASREASRVLHFSLPMLQAASMVTVALVGDALDSGPGIRPAHEIVEFLRRHGVRSQTALREDDNDAGEALLSLAEVQQCDLIAMGCYGHSRVRELLLGGATRTVLTGTHLPVLMAA